MEMVEIMNAVLAHIEIHLARIASKKFYTNLCICLGCYSLIEEWLACLCTFLYVINFKLILKV